MDVIIYGRNKVYHRKSEIVVVGRDTEGLFGFIVLITISNVQVVRIEG